VAGSGGEWWASKMSGDFGNWWVPARVVCNGVE